jgi:hypothetical protein
VAHVPKHGTAHGLVEVGDIEGCPRHTKASKLAQLVEVSIEALRSQNFTQRLALAASGGMRKSSEGSRLRGEGLSQPAKHPLVISVKLDGLDAGGDH